MFRILLVLLLGVSPVLFADEKDNQCENFLNESSSDSRIELMETDTPGVLNVVEIPKKANSGKYVTLYTDKGFAEINTDTGYCNMKSKRNTTNRDQRIVDLYQRKVDTTNANLDKIIADPTMGPMPLMAMALTKPLLMNMIATNCAQKSKAIYAYLEKNNKLPKPTYIDPVPPAFGPTYINPLSPRDGEAIPIPPR